MNRTHDELKSLIAPYVLGAISPEEMEEVRSHIISCEECMAEADGYSGAVSALALSVRPEALPDSLIDNVMRQARADADETPAVTPPTSDDSEGARVTELRRPRPVYGLVAAAAALLLVAVLAGALIATTNDLDDTRDQLALERERVEQLAQTEGAMRLGAPSSEAVGAMLPTDEGGVFVVHGLDDPPTEHTYQVWLLEDGQPTSAGTFDPSSGVGAIQTDHSLDGVDGVAVTVEPEGGSPAPTGDQVLST
jgi:anti-sigma-K factor RskA